MRMVGLLIGLGSALLGWGAIAPPAAAPLEIVSHRLFLTVVVNGTPGRGLLDSAAEMSVMDDDFAARLRLEPAGSGIARGTGGTEKISFAEGVSIQVAGADLRDQRFAVLDLEDLGRRLLQAEIDVI